MENKYTIKYSSTFITQFNDILNYFVYELKNKKVAENFYKEVIEKIEKRSELPESFEVFRKFKNQNANWYKINVKNYVVFYMVKGKGMEVIRIYYGKRNLKKLIQNRK